MTVLYASHRFLERAAQAREAERIRHDHWSHQCPSIPGYGEGIIMLHRCDLRCPHCGQEQQK